VLKLLEPVASPRRAGADLDHGVKAGISEVLSGGDHLLCAQLGAHDTAGAVVGGRIGDGGRPLLVALSGEVQPAEHGGDAWIAESTQIAPAEGSRSHTVAENRVTRARSNCGEELSISVRQD